jgi:hypothetical protein
MSDEKRKKTWREVDSGRDRSVHTRRLEKPGGNPYDKRKDKSYKAELDRYFDHGVASTRIKELMTKPGGAGDKAEQESPERIKLLRKIRSAVTFDQFVDAINKLRAEFGVPNDVDVLARMLEHPDEEAVHEALSTLIDQAKRITLAETKGVIARLEALETATENEKTLSLIRELRAKI